MSNVQRIKKLAKERGIRMGYIYEKIDCSRSKFSDVENGKSSITEKEYSIIADILNTTPEYLKGETDIKEKPTARNGDEHSEIMKKIISGSSKLPEEKQLLVLELIKSMKEDQ